MGLDWMTLITFGLPIAWFIFRLEKHIANDSRVEQKLDEILREIYKK